MIKRRIEKSEKIADRSIDNIQSGYKRPSLKAVALSYNASEDGAPIVIGKGRGKIAGDIIDTAKEHSISIVEDSELVDSLMPTSLGDQIPIELYEAVAHIFVYLSTLDREVGK